MSKKSRPWTRQQRNAIRVRTTEAQRRADAAACVAIMTHAFSQQIGAEMGRRYQPLPLPGDSPFSRPVLYMDGATPPKF